MSTVAQQDRAPARLNVEINTAPLIGGGRLVQDYVTGVDALAPFFGGHFGDIDAYVRKAAAVDARLTASLRARLTDAIHPLGDAADRLHSILHGNGYFVTTGQQPALFGGPLYSLYKGLAAIRLADVLEQKLGRPVLALFWIGSDDHDWDEANHAVTIDAQNYAQRITVSADADTVPLPLSERRWGADVARAVAAFADLVSRTEFSPEVTDHLQRAYAPNVTVGDAFAATLAFLLRDQRIALVSSAAPAVKRASASVVRADIEHAAEHASLLARQTQRLVDAGYHAQVAITADTSNVMLLDAHGRDRLVRSSDGWLTRRERRVLTEAELLAHLDDSPDRFSPNVLLRPVVENAILPTIAYIAGPGEISYYAQIGCLFSAYGIAPPVVVPRPSITLLEPKVRKVLDKASLEPGAFGRPFQELVTEVIRQDMPDAVAAALRALRAALQSGYAELTSSATLIDPTLTGPLTAARNSSLAQINEVEKKITSHLRQKNEVVVEQLRKAAANLYPENTAQERVLSPLPFIARYGPALVPAIAAAMDLEPHHVVSWTGPECA